MVRRLAAPERTLHMKRRSSLLPLATAAALADRIVEHQTTDRTPSRTDDDIAVLVAAHR